MCGRFTLRTPLDALAAQFNATPFAINLAANPSCRSRESEPRRNSSIGVVLWSDRERFEHPAPTMAPCPANSSSQTTSRSIAKDPSKAGALPPAISAAWPQMLQSGVSD